MKLFNVIKTFEKKLFRVSIRILFIIFIVLLIIVSTTLIFREVIARKVLNNIVTKELGLKVTMKEIDVDFSGAHLRLKGVTIHNPRGFHRKELAYIPEIEIHYAPFSKLRTGRWHFYYIGVWVEHITFIKNKDRSINVKELRILKKEDVKREAAPLNINIFQLILQDVYYVDYTPKRSPRTQTYHLDKYFVFKKADSFQDICDLILLEAIKGAKLQVALNVSIRTLSQNVTDTIVLTGHAAKDAVKAIIGIPFVFVK